jgi:hypothetical protein
VCAVCTALEGRDEQHRFHYVARVNKHTLINQSIRTFRSADSVGLGAQSFRASSEISVTPYDKFHGQDMFI